MNPNPHTEKAQQRYLEGAELAQKGEYERAAGEMAAALELDPSLHAARFQLGLLRLTMANPELAREIWAPLERLDDAQPLKWFKQGLEALIRDDFQSCIKQLERGIALNQSNIPLNRDMAMVVAKAAAALSAADPNVARADLSLYDQGLQ